MYTTKLDVIGVALYPATLTGLLCLWFWLTPELNQLYKTHWPEAVTMMFGAFVAGSTPLGGGAVAFPALTKILDYTATDARIFSVMIQSVGMSCAGILFISLRRKVYWKEIGIGLIASLAIPHLIVRVLPPTDTLSAVVFNFFEVVALITIVSSWLHRHDTIQPNKINRLLLFTLIGGLLTLTIGSGADLMLFIYLVLVRKESPVEAIPSTVIFMAINAVVSTLSLYFHQQIHAPIYYSWLAAVPVVAIVAPLGGWVVSQAQPIYVLRFVIGLILFDLSSSVLIGNTPLLPKIIIGIASALGYYFFTKLLTNGKHISS